MSGQGMLRPGLEAIAEGGEVREGLRRGELLRGNIHHVPWPLETAEAEIELNDLPATHGIRLSDTAPLLHYSRELVVYIWSLELAYALGAAASAPLTAAEPL